ncbi:MAG: hypothetical protein JOZ24_05960 [Candidatus Eremiobacteraeota bacterium]|nr:hypothetical protein [Candidatus Eremiobacteraeota bacterium]
MMYDDDELDRALAALPLEEPPPGLHARILAGTVYRPRAPFRAWEVWVLGTCIAFAVWLAWLVVATPGTGEAIRTAGQRTIEVFGLSSLTTLAWLAVGASAAYWISQLSFPKRPAAAR